MGASGGSQYPSYPSGSQRRMEEVPQYVLSTPLPDDEDGDFPTTLQLLNTVARPAAKTGGSRHAALPTQARSKGKQRAVSPDLDPKTKTSKTTKTDAKGQGVKRKRPSQAVTIEVKKQKGRAPGTSNYTEVDIDALCDTVEEHLPLGGKAWNTVGDDYNEWALENGRPERTVKSLEAKFKQVCSIFRCPCV